MESQKEVTDTLQDTAQVKFLIQLVWSSRPRSKIHLACACSRPCLWFPPLVGGLIDCVAQNFNSACKCQEVVSLKRWRISPTEAFFSVAVVAQNCCILPTYSLRQGTWITNPSMWETHSVRFIYFRIVWILSLLYVVGKSLDKAMSWHTGEMFNSWFVIAGLTWSQPETDQFRGVFYCNQSKVKQSVFNQHLIRPHLSGGWIIFANITWQSWAQSLVFYSCEKWKQKQFYISVEL